VLGAIQNRCNNSAQALLFLLKRTQCSCRRVQHNLPWIFCSICSSFRTQVVTIPGAGFGPSGEGCLRLSAFAPREAVVEACARLTKALAPVEA
jgi:hypothetical protein